MSVIIRLQNLPWTANALDIRRFFSGLSVPDGGVHIVGGEKGDAFIAFSTDEDARRAMLEDGGRIGTHSVKLFLSSKTEMQNVIAVARGGAPPPQGAAAQNAALSGPPQTHQYPPHQQAVQVMGNFGPPGGPHGYMPPNSMIPQGQPQGQMRVAMPMEQRVINQDVRPPYNAMPQDHMTSQNRPLDQPAWPNRDVDPRDRGDFGRRDIGPPSFDMPRDMNGMGYNGSGPIDGGRSLNEPMPDYRHPRDNFRGPSPRRELSPPRDRFIDDRRERRKRPYEDSLGVFVSNMPVPLNYRDVRSFFTGLEIPRSGLKLINDRNGQRIGEAYVQFSSEGAAQQALKMDGWMIKGQRVRIEPTTVDKFDAAIDSFIPHGGPPPHPRGDRPMMTKRARSRSPTNNVEGLNIVVKNIPFNATKRDLFRFFTGVRFAKGDISVHLEHSKDGKPAGTALIELFSQKDLEAALSMHRKSEMNGRLIDIINISSQEYASRVERSLKYAPKDGEENGPIEKEEKIETKAPEKKSPSRKVDSRRVDDKKDEKSEKKDDDLNKSGDKVYCLKVNGLPYDCDKATIEKFFAGLQIASKGIRIVYQTNGRAFHTGFVEFVSSEDCKKALAKEKDYIGSRYINLSPVTKQQMMEEFHAMTRKFDDRRDSREGYRGPPSGSADIANQVGRPGCVVGISNLHFNATLEDILSFFHGFSPIADSVKMRYSPEGRPMGDAMVAFHSREDAQHAVREMTRRSLLGREVTLSLM